MQHVQQIRSSNYCLSTSKLKIVVGKQSQFDASLALPDLENYM